MSELSVEQRQGSQPRHQSSAMAGFLGVLCLLMPKIGTVQSLDAPAQNSTADAAEGGVNSETPSSTESGQSPLEESFAPRTRADWVRETRRQAWKDTNFDAQIRSYAFDRNRYDGSESEARALGGSVGLKTGYFRERLAFGATGYTSQKLYAPKTKMAPNCLRLAARFHGGELYGEFLLNEDTRLSVGRRGIDTLTSTAMTPGWRPIPSN